MVLLPSVPQAAGVDEMVGVAGGAVCAALLKEALGAELQPLSVAITV